MITPTQSPCITTTSNQLPSPSPTPSSTMSQTQSRSMPTTVSSTGTLLSSDKENSPPPLFIPPRHSNEMDRSSSGVRSPLRDIANPSQLPTSHPPSPQVTPVNETPSTLAPPIVTVTTLVDDMSPLLQQLALPPSNIYLLPRPEMMSRNILHFTPHRSFPYQRPLQESSQSGDIYTARDV